jgi:hypothetical protein
VKQLTCYGGDGALDARPSWPTAYTPQQTAAFLYKLKELDFVNNLMPSFGSPCSNASIEVLFNRTDSDGQHHLSDVGHKLLGSFVADQISHDYVAGTIGLEAWPVTPKHTNSRLDVCYHADPTAPTHRTSFQQQETSCEEKVCSIEKEFRGDGWAFESEVVNRPDKICWISTLNNTRLTSRAPMSFQYLDLIMLLSPSSSANIGPARKGDTGIVLILCGEEVLRAVNATWANPEMGLSHVEVERIDVQCMNSTLSFVNIFAGVGRVKSKICGVVTYMS